MACLIGLWSVVVQMVVSWHCFTGIPTGAADQRAANVLQLADFDTRTMALIVAEAEIINVRTRDIVALGQRVHACHEGSGGRGGQRQSATTCPQQYQTFPPHQGERVDIFEPGHPLN